MLRHKKVLTKTGGQTAGRLVPRPSVVGGGIKFKKKINETGEIKKSCAS